MTQVRLTAGRRLQHDMALNHLLAFMGLSRFEASRLDGQGIRERISPRYFDGATPFLFLEELRGFGDDERELFTDARPRDLDSALDFTLIGQIYDEYRDETLADKDAFHLTRVRSITPKEARGVASRIYPTMVEVATAQVDCESGRASTYRTIWGESAPGKWLHLSRAFRVVADEKQGTIITMACAAQFTRRYYWTVYLGNDGFPGLTFDTTATAARAVFKFRDLPDDRQRREAIRHWVDEHLRRKPSDEEEAEASVFVRRHLRGAQRFTWNGLNVRIAPPAFEIEQLEKPT